MERMNLRKRTQKRLPSSNLHLQCLLHTGMQCGA